MMRLHQAQVLAGLKHYPGWTRGYVRGEAPMLRWLHRRGYIERVGPEAMRLTGLGLLKLGSARAYYAKRGTHLEAPRQG